MEVIDDLFNGIGFDSECTFCKPKISEETKAKYWEEQSCSWQEQALFRALMFNYECGESESDSESAERFINLLKAVEPYEIDPTMKNEHGDTLLTLAVEKGASVQVLKALLDLGVDPLEKNGCEQNVVEIAKKNNGKDTIAFLQQAVQQKEQERKDLLELKRTELLDAIRTRKDKEDKWVIRDLARECFTMGLDPNETDDTGHTLITLAGQYENFPIVADLTKVGVDPFRMDDNGKTILDYTTDEEIMEVLRWLKKKELVNGMHSYNETEFQRTVQDCIDLGLNLNTSFNGHTLLELAVVSNRVFVVETLLNAGADPLFRRRYMAQGPMDWAWNKDKRIMDALQNAACAP